MKGTLHARLECLRTGGVTERRFRPEERLDEIELTRQEMEYLYDEGDRCVFMHPTSFDQVLLPKAALGNRPARPPPSRRG